MLGVGFDFEVYARNGVGAEVRVKDPKKSKG